MKAIKYKCGLIVDRDAFWSTSKRYAFKDCSCYGYDTLVSHSDKFIVELTQLEKAMYEGD